MIRRSAHLHRHVSYWVTDGSVRADRADAFTIRRQSGAFLFDEIRVPASANLRVTHADQRRRLVGNGNYVRITGKERRIVDFVGKLIRMVAIFVGRSEEHTSQLQSR